VSRCKFELCEPSSTQGLLDGLLPRPSCSPSSSTVAGRRWVHARVRANCLQATRFAYTPKARQNSRLERSPERQGRRRLARREQSHRQGPALLATVVGLKKRRLLRRLLQPVEGPTPPAEAAAVMPKSVIVDEQFAAKSREGILSRLQKALSQPPGRQSQPPVRLGRRSCSRKAFFPSRQGRIATRSVRTSANHRALYDHVRPRCRRRAPEAARFAPTRVASPSCDGSNELERERGNHHLAKNTPRSTTTTS